MKFYYAFMYVKELTDTRLEVVCLFMQKIFVEKRLCARSVCDYLYESFMFVRDRYSQ